MTAQVLAGCFVHEHNPRKVARQEHELAKDHFREVCLHRIAGNVDHDRRFRDAADRLEVALDRWLQMLVDRPSEK